MTVSDFQKRYKACHNDADCQSALIQLFKDQGGVVQEAPGGKVFIDQFGGKVFIPNA